MDDRPVYNDNMKISYTRRLVEIDTIDGNPIQVELWCSDINPKTIKFEYKKTLSVFKCEICGKEFDENKKMLLHKNYHSMRK
jgi:hypothetical protein